MWDEVSGSESDISLSVSCLRAVLLAKMSERLHRLVYRRTLKKIKQNKGKQTKVEDVAVEFIMVSADNLLLKETFLGSRSYENLQADNQERKHPR